MRAEQVQFGSSPETTRVWVSEGGLLKFAFEIAKANITKTMPDAGGVADVNLQ